MKPELCKYYDRIRNACGNGERESDECEGETCKVWQAFSSNVKILGDPVPIRIVQGYAEVKE